MTTCKTIQPRLTAYLDGELAGEPGSVVRGHLRECAACRQIARDEAALRDGLRALAPVDPPVSLWAGVQAKLAAAEVADARTPRWRRGIARWARWAPWPPTMSQVGAGGLLAAAAAVMLVWRGHRVDDAIATPVPRNLATVATEPAHVAAASPTPLAPQGSAMPAGDVTADLIAEPARTTASYAQTIEELMKLTSEASAGWGQDQRDAFDRKVAALRDGVRRASEGRPQQRAQRTLIRYLQGAAVRDAVVLASGGSR
jgi:putative zinc finger protein